MTYPILGQPNTGDTAWMLASSALVLLMTPGLAFFYGGMVRARSVLNMLMMSISAMGVVTVLWVLYGYSLAFGDDAGGVVGKPTSFWGLNQNLAHWLLQNMARTGFAGVTSRWERVQTTTIASAAEPGANSL